MTGPLTGIRVLDMSTVILGPYISQLMGDWGAEVIKIEPLTGDTTRNIGASRSPGMSAMFMNLNRNKRSITLDLTKASGQEALKKLARGADILVHNFRPKPAAKLGVGYADLAAVNPRLISCTTVGYGSKGRYRDRPAYDDLIQGLSGLSGLIGRYLNDDPKYVPSAIADKTGSLMALSAILAALYHREKTGKGQEIEAPMFETLASFLLVEHLSDQTFEPPVGPPGYIRQMSPNRRPFRTQDGYICALPYTDRNWRDFFTLAGRAELADDPQFKDVTSRTNNTAALYGQLEELLQTRTTAEWLADLERLDIPFAPVSSLEDLLADPHLHDVGFYTEYDHPTEGRLRRVETPVGFSHARPSFQFGAPRLGQHSIELLKEAGYSDAEIEALLADGVTSSQGTPAPV